MQKTVCGSILTVFAASLCGLCGCAPDNGKSDPGMSARTSAVVPSATATIKAAPETAMADETSDTRPLLVCFGDSLTAGLGVDPDASYPADMQRTLDARGYRFHVVNEGVSGDTTKDGLTRVAHVLSLKPEWVVVEFGGNDGLRGLPIGDTQKNLATIVNALRKGGAKVLLAGISLPPQYGPDYVGRFNAIYPAVARQANVPLLPFLYKNVYGVDGDIQDDGVHATAKGNVQVAKNIAGALMPLLHK